MRPKFAAFRETGERVNRGDVVRCFHGDEWEFVGVSRAPEPGKSGKVHVRLEGVDREFYPSVFDLELRAEA